MYFEARNISVRYDKVPALRDVSIQLDQGQVVALIGSNGAGKTTTLRAITGLKPRPGRGLVRGRADRPAATGPDRRRGIAMVPEGRHVYPYMSVKDNLLMGAYLRSDKRGDQVRPGQDLHPRFPRVKERMNQQAGTLSGGEQEMVVVGRALMARPRLLLLDEPSLGLAPMVVREIARPS